MGEHYSVILLVSVLSFIFFIHCSIDVRELKCLVCTRTVEEMQKNISSVDSKMTINVGGFRLDDKGNYVEKNIPYSRSEIYLTELMENICNTMDDYVRATFKKSGKLTVIPLMNEGKMNPIMSEVDVVQDSDLNKSLKFYCQDIVDEYDEIFVKEFAKEHGDMITKICSESAQLCEDETIRVSRMTTDEL